MLAINDVKIRLFQRTNTQSPVMYSRCFGGNSIKLQAKTGEPQISSSGVAYNLMLAELRRFEVKTDKSLLNIEGLMTNQFL